MHKNLFHLVFKQGLKLERKRRCGAESPTTAGERELVEVVRVYGGERISRRCGEWPRELEEV